MPEQRSFSFRDQWSDLFFFFWTIIDQDVADASFKLMHSIPLQVSFGPVDQIFQKKTQFFRGRSILPKYKDLPIKIGMIWRQFVLIFLYFCSKNESKCFCSEAVHTCIGFCSWPNDIQNSLTGFFWSAYLANLETWRSIFIEGYEAMPGLVTQQGRFLRWATKATFIARKFDKSIRASKDTSRLYTPQKGFVIFASLSSMALQS